MLNGRGVSAWKAMHGVRDWTFGCALYGTKKEVKIRRDIVKKQLSKYGL